MSARQLLSAGRPEAETVLARDAGDRWLAEHDPFRKRWFAPARDDCHPWGVGTGKTAERLGVTPGAILQSRRSSIANPDVTGGPPREGRHFVGRRGRVPHPDAPRVWEVSEAWRRVQPAHGAWHSAVSEKVNAAAAPSGASFAGRLRPEHCGLLQSCTPLRLEKPRDPGAPLA